MSDTSNNWTLVNHIDHGGYGTLTVIRGSEQISRNLTSDVASGAEYVPWFLGVTPDNKVIMLDQVSKEISLQDSMPKDAYPVYSYRDRFSDRIWFMNDGDPKTGNDTLNCGDKGASVTIIEPGKNGEPPTHVATLCVGRGHHVPTFMGPDEKNPDQAKVVYLSNLLDGTINLINNDESDKANFLKTLQTIDLIEPDKEKDGTTSAPNNAFPHGKQYSIVTGKIYSLNNGYGTVAVINPVSAEIESLIPLKGASNLLLSPCGKFIIGKGADRKSNEEHVIGKLSVIDLQKEEVVKVEDIEDFYPSVYRFNPDGSKLFVTSASTGKGIQKENLKYNTLYVYDASKLPELVLLKTLEVGNCDCGRRPLAFPADPNVKLMFNPNPTDGTVDIIDTEQLEIIKTVKIAEQGGSEFNFSLWDKGIYGA